MTKATKVAAAAQPGPVREPNAFMLYQAVEDLKDLASVAFTDYENDGGLTLLAVQMGEIRDRANLIQAAGEEMAKTLAEYL